MASLRNLFNYFTQKLSCSVALTMEKVDAGDLARMSDAYFSILKNFSQVKLTFLHRNYGDEMAPVIPGRDEMLLVRRIPRLPEDIRKKVKQVFVGDVVVFKDPLDSDGHLVRRVAADGGQELVSTDEKDTPFVLGTEELWVLSDNQNLKPREAKDSRVFGPVSATDIVGRVIYRMQSDDDHGPVQNSEERKEDDEAVLDWELDVDEMAKSPRT